MHLLIVRLHRRIFLQGLTHRLHDQAQTRDAQGHAQVTAAGRDLFESTITSGIKRHKIHCSQSLFVGRIQTDPKPAYLNVGQFFPAQHTYQVQCFQKCATEIKTTGIGFDLSASDTHQVSGLLESQRVEYFAPQRISGEST